MYGPILNDESAPSTGFSRPCIETTQQVVGAEVLETLRDGSERARPGRR